MASSNGLAKLGQQCGGNLKVPRRCEADLTCQKPGPIRDFAGVCVAAPSETARGKASNHCVIGEMNCQDGFVCIQDAPLADRRNIGHMGKCKPISSVQPEVGIVDYINSGLDIMMPLPVITFKADAPILQSSATSPKIALAAAFLLINCL